MDRRSKPVITIDGPAGSGKSTTAKLLAQKLGYVYLDTGAMYRAVTLAVLEKSLSPGDEAQVIDVLRHVSIDLKYVAGEQRTFLNGRDVSTAIRSPEVTRQVSQIAGYRAVRLFLVELQQKIGQEGGYVIDGRDAGSVIFPDAEYKFFMTASLEARAERRRKDLLAMGAHLSVDEILPEIERRDHADSTREESPLVKPVGAVEIDNSDLSIAEQVELMLTKIING